MGRKYDLLTATSMGVRITPANHQPAAIGNLYTMTSTSAESNVLNVAASLGMRAKVLTRFVADSPVAAFIKGDLRRRNISSRGRTSFRRAPGASATSSTSPTPATVCGARGCTTTARAKWAAASAPTTLT